MKESVLKNTTLNYKEQLSNSLKTFLNKHEFFKVKQSEVHCTICDSVLKVNKKSSVFLFESHILTDHHQKSLQNKALFLKNMSGELDDDFHNELMEAFCAANIPMEVFNNSKIRSFLSKWTGKTLFSANVYRYKLLPAYFEKKLSEVEKSFFSKNFYIEVDETCDSEKRKILNVLIGECGINERKRAFLIRTIELEACNSDVIFLEIKCLVYAICRKPENLCNFRLLITDQAPYCIRLGKLLKNEFVELKHITCLVHAIHNVSAVVKENNQFVNTFFIELKKSLLNNPKNERIYKETTRLPNIKWPISIRFGTWINCAVFIKQNLDSIIRYIEKIDKKYHILKDTIKSPFFINELKHVYDLEFLSTAITKLEGNKLSTNEQISILFDVQNKLQNSCYSMKLINLLNNNPDYEYFVSNHFFNLNEAEKNNNFFNYIPMTSMDVERSFSVYRRILEDQRRSLKVDSIFQMIFFNYNDFDELKKISKKTIRRKRKNFFLFN